MDKNSKKQERTVSINEAARIFDLTVPTMRKYKDLGLIQIIKKRSNQDLFDPQDLRKRKEVILKKKVEGFTLRQISRIIGEEMKKEFKKSPKR